MGEPIRLGPRISLFIRAMLAMGYYGPRSSGTLDVEDNLPRPPVSTNAPIDLGTQANPTLIIPSGVYDYDDAHPVHINVATDATGIIAAPG